MFATNTNLSDRNLLSSTWSEVINIYLLSDEELNLLARVFPDFNRAMHPAKLLRPGVPARPAARQPTGFSTNSRRAPAAGPGSPPPRGLGYALYPTLHGTLWRADVVTREIPDGADLAKVLGTDADSYDHATSIEATITLRSLPGGVA